MRIIIESTEQASEVEPSDEPTSSDHIETIDGGAPSESLVHAIAGALPVSTEREEMDGGTPPEWLLEAIGGAAQHPVPRVLVWTAPNIER